MRCLICCVVMGLMLEGFGGYFVGGRCKNYFLIEMFAALSCSACEKYIFLGVHANSQKVLIEVDRKK